MMAGIVWQVITLLAFAFLVTDYSLSAYKGRSTFTQATVNLLSSRNFKLFASGLVVSFLAIFIRCVFRIAEMAGGWANPIMRNEAEFIVLDSLMCAIAALCLTIFHPGLFFKPMVTYKADKKAGRVVFASEKVEDIEASSR